MHTAPTNPRHRPAAPAPPSASLITPALASELLRPQAATSLSVLLPLHHGPEQRADHIVLKNLLREADELDPSSAPSLTKRVRALTAPDAFWSHAGSGLAIYDNGSALRYAWLDAPPAAVAVVGRRFHVAPIYDHLRAPRRFAVLELGQRGVALLDGDRRGLSETTLVWPHVSGPAQRGAHDHGLGQRFSGSMVQSYGASPEPDMKERALEFFREIDHKVRAHLGNDGPPLYLVGVEWLLPVYRETNRYQRLMDAGWAHGADHVPREQVHRWCCQRMEERAGADLARIQERHQILTPGPRISAHLEQALPSASAGMAASAIIASDRQRWGTFDAVSGAVAVHDQRLPGDEDLLNTLFCVCALGGAESFMVPHAQVPSGLDCSVMLRY